MKAVFSTTSSNFWVNILTFVLATIALAGVELPATPDALASNISNTLSTSGWVALIGVIILNVGNPLYHAFMRKTFNLKAILGSSNFWINVASLGFALAVMGGVMIPDGTAEEIVGAIYGRDWTALAIILFTNVINPLVRFFRDKAQANPTGA